MKLESIRKLSKPVALFTAGFVFFSAVPIQAQLVVHDPLNDIQLIYANGTLAQQVTESVQLFNLAYQETNALRNKQYMQAAGYLSNFATISIPGHGDWTIAMSTVGGVIPASVVWNEMISAIPGGLPYTTIQNRVQLSDAMGPSMIDALGGCNASLLQSDGAISALEQIALSTGASDNSNDSLGAETGVGAVQQLRIQECEHNLQQQQAQLQLLGAMRQRDYENQQVTMYQNIDLIASTTPTGFSNISGLLLADF